MDKTFWRAIVENECNVPDGYTPSKLLPELFENLGSLDSELRDDLTLTILSNWLETRKFTTEEMVGLIDPLKENLKIGLGENGTNSVFQRTFSVITLAELVHVDNKDPYLTHVEVLDILEAGLEYLEKERDLRGYVPVRGWAHAVAHTADLLMVLSRSEHCSERELRIILESISARLINSGHALYTHDEDERLVNVLMELLNRNLVSPHSLTNWVKSLSLAETGGWKDAYLDPSGNMARHNVKTFLRSLHYRLVKAETAPPHSDILIASLREGLKVITPWA